MHLLAVNVGSSTVKLALFRAAAGGASPAPVVRIWSETRDISASVGQALLDAAPRWPARPDAVVHRVVHGGDEFAAATPIDPSVERRIEALGRLAPLHNPPALEGIRAARALGVPMIAVFDTAFFRELPSRSARYALPASVGDEVRRYGFHGLSHQSVLRQYAAAVGRPEPTVVTLHLGAGCSAAAIERGRCVDTSMGMTPFEGLVMATRAGDLDPAILLYLIERGRTTDELWRLLARESGLTGLAGTGDVRALLARQDEDARLALDVFCHRVRQYLGAYLAVLGGAEAVIFTGGIGENAPEIRRRVVSGMEWLGLALDEDRNLAGTGRIGADDARIQIWAIPTDEETEMARAALACLGSPAASAG